MNIIQALLCPSTTMNDISHRAELIRSQLTVVQGKTQCTQPLKTGVMCPICSNTNEKYMVQDHGHGDLICLGSDGQGCGGVVCEELFEEQSSSSLDSPMDEDRWFSPQYEFRSSLVGPSPKFKRVNNQIERQLTLYGKSDPDTTDYYKDQQRQEVYNLLEQIQMTALVDRDWIQRTKNLFHLFRTCMSRIHKVNVAVAALFYLTR
jgi:hypothetical protein